MLYLPSDSCNCQSATFLIALRMSRLFRRGERSVASGPGLSGWLPAAVISSRAGGAGAAGGFCARAGASDAERAIRATQRRGLFIGWTGFPNARLTHRSRFSAAADLAAEEGWSTGRELNPRILVLQTSALAASPPVPLPPRQLATDANDHSDFRLLRLSRGAQVGLYRFVAGKELVRLLV